MVQGVLLGINLKALLQNTDVQNYHNSISPTVNGVPLHTALVKLDLRGQPRETHNLTGDPLIQVHLHNIVVQGTWKRWLLWKGDP